VGDERGAVRVRLLGGLSVEGIDEHALGSRKARLLLKRLAVARGDTVTTGELADVVWPSTAPSSPNEQVGVLVSRLRRVLGSSAIVHADAGYRLVVDWLDIDELSARVEEASGALSEGRHAAAGTAAHAATAIARGRLLPDDEGEWVGAARVWCDALVGRAHRIAAEAALGSGDPNAASASAETALLWDPYDESALRTLMRAHAAAGRPASGLAVYVRVRERLLDDLGVTPAAETEQLHDALVLGALDPEPAPAEGRGEPTILGRDRELAALDRALGRAAHGGAAAVLVRGEAGIGKSSLLEAWIAALGPGVLTVWCRCDPLGRDLPLQPLVDGVAKHLDALGPTSSEAIGDAGDVLGRLLGSTVATVETSSDPGMGKAQLFTALLSVVERLGEGVVVVIVEDIQHAGVSTREWISFANRRGRRLLVVASSADLGEVLPGGDVLDVGPLPREAAVELIGAVGDAGRADEIIGRAGGNPLFLLALADSDSDELPSSISEAVDRQVAVLGVAGEAVRAAAIIGGEIDLDLVSEVIAAPAVAVLADLEKACHVGLLEERATGFTFRHELVRDALDAGAGSARRALVHRDVARLLCRREGADPLAIAVHARLGGETGLAVEGFVAAGRAAFARHDGEAALGHLGSALALAEDPAAYALRARVRLSALDLAGAEADAAAAVALGGGAEALEVAAWVAYYRRQYDQARVYADAGADSATDEVLAVSCLAVGGRVRHAAGDLEGAEQRLLRHEPAAVGGRGVSDVWLAHLRVHQGRPGEALEIAQRALIDADRTSHPWAGLHGRFARIMALGQLGRVEEALLGCDQMEDVRRRLGSAGDRFEGIAANGRGWLLRNVGCISLADESNERALAAHAEQSRLTDVGLTEAYWVAHLDLIDGRLLAGDLEGAMRRIADVDGLDEWNGTMAWHQRHRLGLLRARAALMAGELDSAHALADTVRVDAARRGARRYQLLASAVTALCDQAPDVAEVGAVIEGLNSCARLEGWRLAAALANRLGVDAWRIDAERSAASVIAASGAHADTARRWVERAFSAPSTM
jgi:DNA-binding SARP family transcriptional activator